MTRPGDRLRAVASHLFDEDTMEHLIDPILADLRRPLAGRASISAIAVRRTRLTLYGTPATSSASITRAVVSSRSVADRGGSTPGGRASEFTAKRQNGEPDHDRRRHDSI